MGPMRLVFFGSGSFGLPTLRALAATHEIVAVVSQPDRPAGRGARLTPTPIAAWAAEHLSGATLLKPERVSAPEVAGPIRALNADAWVVIAFGQKLARALLEGVFAVNLHASLLPRWRGAAPINAAILGGDTETGNSVITLANRMDAGFILGQSRRVIDPAMTAGELHDLLAADGPALVEDVLSRHVSGRLEPRAQVESEVTIAPKLNKQSGAVSFDQDAEWIRRRVHGLTPWPGVTIGFGTATSRVEPAGAFPEIKLLRVRVPETRHEGIAGVVLDAGAGTIACGEGTVLEVVELQPAGKRPMRWQDFRSGAGRMLPPGMAVRSAQEAA